MVNCEQTDMTESITFPQTTHVGGNQWAGVCTNRAPLELKVWLQL